MKKNYRHTSNLAELLGDGASIVVNKSIYSIKGNFAIVIPDRPDQTTGDTIYANLAPMDHVEIRMAHDPSSASYNGKLPLVMRGFITQVERRAALDASGRPTNLYVIHGSDYGRILEQLKIYYTKDYATGSVLSSKYAIYTKYLLNQNTMSAKTFFEGLINQVVNPYLQGVKWYKDGGDSSEAMSIKPEMADVDASVWVQGISSFEGSIWELLSSNADLAWHELFIEDREDAPYLVYRPNPFKEISGEDIQQKGFVAAKWYDKDNLDLQSINAERSDANVANWFVLQSPLMGRMFGASYNRWLMINNDQWTYLKDYEYCLPTLYGDRKLEVTINQAPLDHPTSINGVPASKLDKLNTDWIFWLTKRRETLAKFNRDNAVWESGTLAIVGDEAIKPGRYLYLTRGGMKQWMYLTHVTHTFHPYHSFTTTTQFTRGSGWLVRQTYETNPSVHERTRDE